MLIGLLMWPMLFTDATLNGEWPHHLWLIWNQSQAIRSNDHPTLFLNYSHGIFYPQYAFYGATIYAVTAVLSLAMGGAPIEVVSVSPAHGLPVVLGRMITLVAAIFLVGELLVLAACRARTRRAGRAQ